MPRETVSYNCGKVAFSKRLLVRQRELRSLIEGTKESDMIWSSFGKPSSEGSSDAFGVFEALFVRCVSFLGSLDPERSLDGGIVSF